MFDGNLRFVLQELTLRSPSNIYSFFWKGNQFQIEKESKIPFIKNNFIFSFSLKLLFFLKRKEKTDQPSYSFFFWLIHLSFLFSFYKRKVMEGYLKRKQMLASILSTFNKEKRTQVLRKCHLFSLSTFHHQEIMTDHSCRHLFFLFSFF